MSLTIGELVGYIDLEDQGFTRKLDQAGRRFESLESTTNRASIGIEATVSRAFAQVADAIDRGFDPDSALSDIDRMTDGFLSAMDSVTDGAEHAGDESGRRLAEGLGDGADDVDAEFAALISRMGDVGAAAEFEGKRLSDAFDDGNDSIGNAIANAATLAKTLGLVGTAGVAAGLGLTGMLGILGLGVIGLGGFLATTEKIKKEFKEFGKDAEKAFRDAAKPLQGPILDGLERLSEKLDPLADAFGKAFTKLAPLIDTAFDTAIKVVDSLIAHLPGIVEAGKPVAEFLITHLGGALSKILEFLDWVGERSGALSGLVDKLDLSGVLASFEEVRTKVVELVSGVVESVKTWIADNKGLLEEFASNFETYFGEAKGVVEEALGFIKAVWDKWGDEILTAVTIAFNTISSFISGILKTIKGVFQLFTGLLTGDWSKAWEGLKSIVSGAFNGIFGFLNSIMSKIVEGMGMSWEKVKKAAGEKIDQMIAAVKAMPGKMKEALANAATILVSVGRDLIAGMINGIKAKATELVSAARDTVTRAVDAAKQALGIASPSKVAELEIGAPLAMGIAVGILSREAELDGALTGVLDRVGKKAADKVGTLTASLKSQMGAMEASLGTKAPSLPGAPGAKSADTKILDYSKMASFGLGQSQGMALGEGGQGGVNITMNGTVVREEADIQRIGAAAGFELMGLV